MRQRRRIFSAISVTLLGLYRLTPTALAQNTVYFSTSDAGQTKSIAQWGVEVVDGSSDNMRQSIANMGANNINLIAVNFWVDEALQANGQIGPNSMSRINSQLAIAAMAGNKPIIIGPNVGDTDASYLNGSGQVSVAQWVKVLQATKTYLNSQGYTLGAVSPFNEPDYWSGQGTPQNLHDIMASLRSDPNFNSVSFIGASTLSSDPAQSWYDAISGVTQYGSTHVLGGSANSYANFFQHVTASGGIPSAPELHGLGEAIYAAEYGVQSAQWWGPALQARGLFVQTSQGKQLGYAENRANATAATVYRGPDGSIRAFAGGFERFGASTPYRFVSTDRDVYFNGVGPIRQYMIQAGQGDEAYADIQYGPNPEPALDGNRWEIVNRQTGQVLQVAGAGTANGAAVNSGSNTGALYQQWNITRNKDGYYALFNANSGLTADVVGGSTLDGAKVDQFGMADNLIQQWYINDAGNGYYYIRNGNSNEYLTSSTTQGIQFRNNGSQLQQWQFVLSNPAPTGTLKTQYQFEGNVNDSAGANNAVTFGTPTYSSGPTAQGQAINLNGTDAYVKLPSGVANSSDITLSAIVKWNGGNAWQRIFDFGTGTTSYMFLTPQSGDNTMRFAITTAGNTSEQILDTDPLPVGQWTQLAVTLSGNTGILYINGKPIVAGQITLNPSDVNATLNYIGKSQFASDPLFSGSIDDFRIYDYALSQAQMLNLVPRRWTGSLNTNWTTTTLANPKNWQAVSTATDYATGDVVLFDDNAASFTVNVTDATVTPSSVQFNNSANNYILNGPGSVAGSGALTKSGTSALTINNSNSYTGGTTLNAGTLNINNASAIGTGVLTIAGGAINNTSGASVTLSTNNAQTWSGDFTFGGSNALNMGNGPVTMTGNRTVTTTGSGALTVGPIGQSGGSWQLTKTGNGTLILSGSNTYTGGTTVNGGLLVAQTFSNGSLTVTAGKAQVIQNASPNQSTGTTIIPALNITGGAVDLTNNALVIDYTTLGTQLTDLRAHLQAGRLMTSLAAGGFTIGYADNASLGRGTWGNVSVGSTTLLAGYVYSGDANLDGKVNLFDLNALATNFGKNSGNNVWVNGDFNYDGNVNIADFNALAMNFNQTLSLAPSPALGSLVPEPAMAGAIGLFLICAGSARQRNRFTVTAVQ